MYYETSAEPRSHIDGVPVFCAYDELVPIDRLIPNPKNPNKHPAKQIKMLEGVIRSTGWRNNITVSLRSGMIVKGHGRYLAAQKLGASCVPVEYQDYTSEAEEYADMAADNRLAELSQTDKKALAGLLTLIQEDVPLELAGFDAIPLLDDGHTELTEATSEDDPEAESFEEKMAEAAELYGEDSPEYAEFLEKFKPKRTTDDCYTPPLVYETVRDWACEEYGIDPERIVRPFFPGGNYETFSYPKDCTVLDNPPFSILTKICKFYLSKNIRFFLFCPSLSSLSGSLSVEVTHIFCDANIVYDNGAIVGTAFVTNLGGDVVATTAPELRKRIADAVEAGKNTNPLPKYAYPDHVLTSAMLQKYAANGLLFSVRRNECHSVRALDAQRKTGAKIYGGGLLLSDAKAAERAAAERAAAERVAERAAERAAECFELSDREWDLVRSLG